MRNHLRYRGQDAAKRCAICDGKFGLVRHYAWRTALCSRGCLDRLRSREESDRRWLLRLQTAQQTIAIAAMGLRSGETGHANGFRR
jgi:hypothetical protein